MSERYFCDVGECGRAFTSPEDLASHKQRRHPGSSSQSSVQESESVSTPKLSSFKADTLRRPLSGVTNPRQAPPKPKNIDLEEIKEILGQTSINLEKTKAISEEYVLDLTGQDELEDVNMLILRDIGISEFRSSKAIDLSRLISLEFLSLSHNRIKEIEGVSECICLRELNINNNLIEDLSPLENLIQLKKLYCANNNVRVVLPLKTLRDLEVLGLFNNKIFDLEETIKVFKELPKLKEIELDRNPCILQVPHSKYRLVRHLKVTVIDGEEVTQMDQEIAQELFGDEAPIVPRNFVGRLRTTIDIEENKERELLYHEIESLKEQLEEVTKQRDEFRYKLQHVESSEVEELTEENSRLKREVANMYVLLDEINDMKRNYEDSLDDNAHKVYQENARLRARIVELESRAIEAPKITRPQTSYGIQSVPAAPRPATSAGLSKSEDPEIEEMIQKNERLLMTLKKQLRAVKLQM
jgi:hypothetical protein